MRTIIEMVHRHPVLLLLLSSAALMRQGLVQALHHTAATARPFRRRLIQQPLMRNVLADLALEAEAALALSLTHRPRHG